MIPEFLKTDGHTLIQTHLLNILNYAKNNKNKADKSWPVLLKSNAFFNYICAYMEGDPFQGADPSRQSKRRRDAEMTHYAECGKYRSWGKYGILEGVQPERWEV